jgi:hypothetical protein
MEPFPTHLERQSRLDFVCKYFSDRFVEVCKNLHGELGFDPALGDEIVKGVREGPAHAAICQPKHARSQRVQAIPASPVELIVLGRVGHGDGFSRRVRLVEQLWTDGEVGVPCDAAGD